jgi:hypothetical protein
MYFKKKANVIFRNYDSFGYITDNRNFGYKLLNNTDNYIGDKILSESGALFFSALDEKTLTLDEIAKNISIKFPDVDIKAIKKDANDFYSMLENDGFIVSGKTLQECSEKDFKFSYKTIRSEITIDSNTEYSQSDKSTQDFFEEYFNGKSQLTNVHIEISSKCAYSCPNFTPDSRQS